MKSKSKSKPIAEASQPPSMSANGGAGLLGWQIGLIAAAAGLIVLIAAALLVVRFMKSKKSNNANSRTDTPTPLRYDAPPSVVAMETAKNRSSSSSYTYDVAPTLLGSDNQYESPGDALVM
jgi:hypothetical protein